MFQVILTIHVLLAIGLIGVILVQRSEGGALGMGGGGGGGGGFMTGRGTANLLTRTTAVLAALFIATSLALAIFSGSGRSGGGSIFDRPAAEEPLLPLPPASAPAPQQPQVPLGEQ